MSRHIVSVIISERRTVVQSCSMKITQKTTRAPLFYRWFKNILSPGTEYVANVRIDGHWLEPQTFKTKGSSRPYNWNWYSDIAQGKPIKLSAREWNDFCTKSMRFESIKDYRLTILLPYLAVNHQIFSCKRSSNCYIGYPRTRRTAKPNVFRSSDYCILFSAASHCIK